MQKKRVSLREVGQLIRFFKQVNSLLDNLLANPNLTEEQINAILDVKLSAHRHSADMKDVYRSGEATPTVIRKIFRGFISEIIQNESEDAIDAVIQWFEQLGNWPSL